MIFWLHLWFLDRRPDQIAPFGPGAVVVLHVLEAEKILHRKPRQARALTDAAVGDDRLVARNPLLGIQRLQLAETLEGPIVVAVLPPRNALGAGNVATALAGLRQSGRGEN